MTIGLVIIETIFIANETESAVKNNINFRVALRIEPIIGRIIVGIRKKLFIKSHKLSAESKCTHMDLTGSTITATAKSITATSIELSMNKILFIPHFSVSPL